MTGIESVLRPAAIADVLLPEIVEDVEARVRERLEAYADTLGTDPIDREGRSDHFAVTDAIKAVFDAD